MLIVRAQLKEVAKECGMENISNDFPDKLDDKVKEIVKEACRRAKDNGRKTLMIKDI